MMDQSIKAIIEENPISLATINDSKPNIIVVACAKVISDNSILIIDNYMNQTITDLQRNPDICLAVWNNKWEGYKLIGQAKYYNDGEWLKKVKELPENKGLPAKGAILLKVSSVIKLH